MITPIQSWEEYQDACAQAIRDPEAYWAKQAETFHWFNKWENVLHADMHHAHNKWFIGGKLNITTNCLDRHLEERGDQVAILWEPNNPDDAFVMWGYQTNHLHQISFRYPGKL